MEWRARSNGLRIHFAASRAISNSFSKSFFCPSMGRTTGIEWFVQIRDHYNEDPNYYADAIQDITDTREAARTPARNAIGINLLFRYYNHLYYVERRFFPYGEYFMRFLSHTQYPCFMCACAIYWNPFDFTTLHQLNAIYNRHSIDKCICKPFHECKLISMSTIR